MEQRSAWSRVAFRLALLLPLSASQANAEPSRDASFYIGADLGQATLHRDHQRIEPLAGSERHNLGWQLRFGYQFTRHLAAEVSYSDFGTYAAFAPFAIPTDVDAPLAGDFTTSASAFGISLVGSVPVGKHFHITATAGLMRREFNTLWRQPDPYFPQPRETDGDLASRLGAGFGVALRGNVDLDLNWVNTRHVEGDTEFATNASEPAMFSLGVRFRL